MMASVRVFTFRDSKHQNVLRKVTVTATSKKSANTAVQNVLKGQSDSRVQVTGGGTKSPLG
jgi:hypothetical protein